MPEGGRDVPGVVRRRRTLRDSVGPLEGGHHVTRRISLKADTTYARGRLWSWYRATQESGIAYRSGRRAASPSTSRSQLPRASFGRWQLSVGVGESRVRSADSSTARIEEWLGRNRVRSARGGPARSRISVGRCGCGPLNELDIQLDEDVIGHGEPAVVEQLVVLHAEILAIDRAGG